MSTMQVQNPLRKYCLIPATLTPMNRDFEVDYEQLENYVRRLVKHDVGGAAVNVDTGEGPHLYPEECDDCGLCLSICPKGATLFQEEEGEWE